MLDRRIEVDDLVLDPDLVPKRDDLDEAILALVASEADPPAGRLDAIVVVGPARKLGRPLADDERDAAEQDLLDPGVEGEDPAVEVGVALEVQAVDLAATGKVIGQQRGLRS